MSLLTLAQLTVQRGETRLLDCIDMSIQPGEVLALIGESGCGKSLLGLAIMGLLPAGMQARGEIRLDGANLLALDDTAMCQIRGRRIAMVFQNPRQALNPVQPIGRQVAEAMRLDRGVSRSAQAAATGRLLDRVGLGGVHPSAYPHQLSGGQVQRVMIAVALARGPSLLIADEFSASLDNAAQTQILGLLAELAEERRMAVLLITHDLGLAAYIAQRVHVLYAGRTAETGPAGAIFAHPRHPYSAALLACTLRGRALVPGTALPTIPGQVPAPAQRPAGCAFAARCGHASARCAAAPQAAAGSTLAYCWHTL